MRVLKARTSLADFERYVFGWDVQPFQEEWQRAVEDPELHSVLIYASVEHGKSQNFSVAYPLFEMGRNVDIRIALICLSSGQAEKFLGEVKEIITGDSEISIRYREVFPHVQRGKTKGKFKAWDKNAIIIERNIVSPDYTMAAIGVGKSFLGARYDRIIYDDILDMENTSTDVQRNKIEDWMNSTAETRLVANGKSIFITTAWNEDDAAHRCEASGEWVVLKTPAIATLPNGDPDWSAATAWPSQWPIERLQQKFRKVGRIEFARQFLCLALSDAQSIFKSASFEFALKAGADYTLFKSYAPVEAEKDNWIHTEPVYVGLDPNIKKKRTSDDTGIFVACVHADNRRRILHTVSEKLDGGLILDALAELKVRYKNLVGVFVEDVGAQDYLVQFAKLRKDMPPIKGFTTTGKNKLDPERGVPSLATELDNGLWIFPNKTNDGKPFPQIFTLMHKLKTWNRKEHTADIIMAMWFCREAILSTFGMPIRTGGEKREFVKHEESRFHDSQHHAKSGFHSH